MPLSPTSPLPLPARLLLLSGTGAGRYYARCHCLRTSPAVDAPDDLRALAAATRAGWRALRRADGTYEVSCPACVARGRFVSPG